MKHNGASIFNRRQFFRSATGLSLSLPFLLHAEEPKRAFGLVNTEQYFIHFFLLGAADGFLAIDPVVGDKARSGRFDPTHTSSDFSATAVPGKDQLLLGKGFAPAAGAFSKMPTAFVRGIYIEVTAHATAQNYNYSGRSSLSATRTYPSIGQQMANVTGGFPGHICLGPNPPLVDTDKHLQPRALLSANNVDSIANLVDRPGLRFNYKTSQRIKDVSDKAIHEASQLIESLDNLRAKNLSSSYQGGLKAWNNAKIALDRLYQSDLGLSLRLTEDTLDRYGGRSGGEIAQLVAGTFLSIKSGICPILTVSFDGFDTHFNHFANHVPLQQQFATALSALVADLSATPALTGGSLADKTTILITTDFGRTPDLNGNRGTDHWDASWAVVMGAGIRDNTIIGGTDTSGKALGWSQGTLVPFAKDHSNALFPEHLIATILKKQGFPDAASLISEVQLHELLA